MPWTEKNNALEAEFTFPDFTTAFSFMTHVAFAAEAANHHPEWTNVYNRVTIRLTTHDAGNTVTEKDRNLAAKIDVIYAKYA
ncbi:MAG: 4a-hydroxytetrahydrobiopterin dehydratase [Bacteroidota bacterium]